MAGKPNEKILKIRKLSGLVSLIVLIVISVTGIFLINTVASQIFNPYKTVNAFYIGSALTSLILVLLFYTKLFHYREKTVLETSKDPEFFLEKEIEESASTKLLEKTGWEVKNKEKEYIEFVPENPSWISKWLGSETTLKAEIQEEENNTQKTSLIQNGEEIEIDSTEYRSSDKGTIITNIGTTRNKVSLLQLITVKLQIPWIKKIIEETTEGNAEIQNRKMDIGLKKYKLD